MLKNNPFEHCRRKKHRFKLALRHCWTREKFKSRLTQTSSIWIYIIRTCILFVDSQEKQDTVRHAIENIIIWGNYCVIYHQVRISLSNVEKSNKSKSTSTTHYDYNNKWLNNFWANIPFFCFFLFILLFLCFYLKLFLCVPLFIDFISILYVFM